MGSLIRISLVILFGFSLTGCGYYFHTSYNQSKILLNREKIDKVLKDPKLPSDKAEKIRLVQKAKDFAIHNLGLKKTKSYESYVALDRNAVTYVVQVAPYDKLEHYTWWYPIVGRLPYKGYFNENMAKDEAKTFETGKNKGKYDTYVRGVRAYSTLGWFNDPLTSPMLDYAPQDLVETIIHELTHTTLYIKSQADFNERLATFVGIEGSKRFFINTEGEESPTTRMIGEDQKDLEVFSAFLSVELKELRDWYIQQKDLKPETKEARIRELQKKFTVQVKPKLKGKSFSDFGTRSLNNAILMSYQTYISDLKIFDQLLQKLGDDLPKFIIEVKKLESSDQPERDFLSLLGGL